jgi:hypothetical protein
VARQRRRSKQRKRPRPGGHPARQAAALRRPTTVAVPDTLAERAFAEARRRTDEMLSVDTPPERLAELLAEQFRGLPAPAGLTLRLKRDGSEDRVRAVAAELQRLDPDSVTALTLAAEVARLIDDDPDRGNELLDRALDAFSDPEGSFGLARHLLAAGRSLDTIELVRELLAEEPDDEEVQDVYAAALGQMQRRVDAGEQVGRPEREELDRFSDRTGLYALRDAMRVLVEERRPELQARLDASIRDWMGRLLEAQDGDVEELLGLGSDDPERSETLLRFAIEHAWLLDDEEDEAEADQFGLEREIEKSGALMALLASDPTVGPEISHAAGDWLQSVTYGLWQVPDPEPGPGLWLTDIVSGARRYVAVPSEQLPGMNRWSVILAAVVSLDGVWRSTGAIVLLRPSEGDAAAEWVHDAGAAMAQSLAGKRGRRPSRRREPDPHGVLAEVSEPVDPAVAGLLSKVLGSLLPGIVGEVWRRRQTGPKLTNTEGHHLQLIEAQVAVSDPAGVARRLAIHPDFRTEDEGELSWWGRELTDTERAGMAAQIRALAGEGEAIEEPDEPQRWLRGRVHLEPDRLGVSVNSKERLQALLELLSELDADPQLRRRSVIDPAQDMPPIRLGAPMPFGASKDAVDAWQSLWPKERVPALGGVTPRSAARRQQSRPRLEAVLREFEHDSYALARAGKPAPDLNRLRAELGMKRWWQPPPEP